MRRGRSRNGRMPRWRGSSVHRSARTSLVGSSEALVLDGRETVLRIERLLDGGGDGGARARPTPEGRVAHQANGRQRQGAEPLLQSARRDRGWQGNIGDVATAA